MEQQFTQACEEYSDALFRYCFLKVSDRDVAKDLVQETYMKVWSFITKGEKIQNIRAYFYKTLSNLIIDFYRKKKSVSLDQITLLGFDPTYENKENIEDKIDGEQAIKILKFIPEMYREVIFMRYVEDMTLREISKITKESENTIAVKIHRGLKKIKKIYNEKGNVKNE